MSRNNSSDYYKNLIQKNNPNYHSILKALDIVRDFIIKKDLILSGGMAIDFALRLKGDFIYSDDQIPDYDFYSPNHYSDAYELSTMLCEGGFENVHCINGFHITTMKVRIDFEDVADITYCPPNVFSRVPVMHYDKLKIVHPHWQMIDQHRALSLPFENPGREVIFDRWEKDMVRYDKLYSYYPVVPEASDQDSIISENLSKPIRTYKRTSDRERMSAELEIPMQTVRVPLSLLSGSCISGWGAVEYKLDNDHIILSIPVGENISVATYDYKGFIEKHNLEIIEYQSEYFGKLPRKVVCSTPVKDMFGRNKKIDVFDIFGMLLSAKRISKEHDVWVCNLQWVMLYLLIRIFSSDSKKIVFTAEEQYVKCKYLVIGGEPPSIEVYGKHNFSLSTLVSIRKDKEKIYRIKSKQIQPSNFYLSPLNCNINKSFDYESSEYFTTDARKLNGFNEKSIDPYPEYNSNSVKN
jgi:hypothetical protein